MFDKFINSLENSSNIIFLAMSSNNIPSPKNSASDFEKKKNLLRNRS